MFSGCTSILSKRPCICSNVHTTRHHVQRTVPQDVRDDLRWYLAVLSLQHKFNLIPVNTSRGCSHHRAMSSWMLPTQGPAYWSQYIRVEFSEAVRQSFAASKEVNSINVRKLMSAALAALHWGPVWESTGRNQPRDRMWIDNTSAVAWLNRRSCRHPVARTYNRLNSLLEFQHTFTCSAARIPREQNIVADAGSRACSADHPLYRVWTNLSYP